MDTAMQQTSPRFWNRIARKYARSPITDEAAYRRKLRVTQSYMTPDMHVLEFGCGTGGTALLHAPHVARYLAVDFSEEMIRIGREKAADAGSDSLELEVAGIETLPGPGRPWDMVLALSVLHLVPARREVIEKVYAMLAPGGYFVTSTTCLGDWPWYMRAFAATGSAVRFFPYVSLLRSDTLRDELQAAGFALIEDWQPERKSAAFLVARKPGTADTVR